MTHKSVGHIYRPCLLILTRGHVFRLCSAPSVCVGKRRLRATYVYRLITGLIMYPFVPLKAKASLRRIRDNTCVDLLLNGSVGKKK